MTDSEEHSDSRRLGEPTIQQIPARMNSNDGTPLPGTSPSRGPSPLPQSYRTTNGFRLPDDSQPDMLSEEEKARRVRAHLPSYAVSGSVLPSTSQPGQSLSHGAEDREDFPFDEEPSRPASSPPIPDVEEEITYHHSLSGDVTHDLFKYARDNEAKPIRRSRSVSFAGTPRRGSVSSNTGEPDDDLDIRAIREPGGFRRNFLQRKADQAGQPRPKGPLHTASFVEFLSLYGHFGGEDLEEIDEEEEEEDEDEEEAISREAAMNGQTERSPLLKRSQSSKPRLGRRRSSSAVRTGDATVTQAVMMLLKSFIGTGVLFLSKAFFNGGILFSSIVLITVAMISLYAFLLLVKTRLVVPGSFGDIGGQLYGQYMRFAILSSIALSQIGFVSAYTIFVADNLQAFVLAVTHGKTFISTTTLIFSQLLIFVPFAMIRNIQKLSGTALVADAFILAGLIYIFGSEIAIIGRRGVAHVELFNPKDFSLFIGTAVFSFEGIGLIIPITESMAEPRRFPAVITYVMFFLTSLFVGAGCLGYLTFGSDIKAVVILNLPQNDKLLNAVQFLYSVAIILSAPLQLYPAIQIIQNGVFSRSGKNNTRVKWEKNILRFTIVLFCTLVGWIGASDLDKFVSIVGSVACVPLCFCYPALLHYRACAHTTKQKVLDILLFVFGVLVCIYCSVQTFTMIYNTSG